jgi:hypothetical protein
MAETNCDSLTVVHELSGKIALELVFALPGQDSGLLPVNNLLAQIEEASAASPLPPPIPRAIAGARAWINEILDTTAVFDEASLRRLGEWSQWLPLACEAARKQQTIPDLPSGWEQTPQAAVAPLVQAAPPSETDPG